jgi:hypothetical protein
VIAHGARVPVRLLLMTLAATLVLLGCARPAPPGPATMRASLPPWPAPSDAVSYIAAAGVEPEPYATSADARLLNLDLQVESAPVEVPAGIGFDRSRALQAPAHTHDDSGTVTVEGKGAADFTLGQFFTLWGVRLSPSCVGGVCGRLLLRVDGAAVTSDPREVRLWGAERIELTVSSS